MEMKQIPKHPQYSISACGLYVSRDVGGRNRTPFIKQTLHKVKGKEDGYLYVTLLSEGRINTAGEIVDDYPVYKCVSVHRLVALTFLGDPPDGKPWINHKDGNKANNHVSNLEWTSISENIQHKFDAGLQVMPKGSDHWKYGKKPSKETRQKMSRAKIGENHPKFKGWYVVNGKKYASTYEAAKELGTYPKRIYIDCMKKRDLCYFLPVDLRKIATGS